MGPGFASLFRLDGPTDPTRMPLYAEFVRTERVAPRAGAALARRSVELLRKHLERRPRANPIARFSAHLREDVERLKSEGLAAYHLYAFATIRQLGAAFELGAMYLRWLSRHDEGGLTEIADDLMAVSGASKS